MLCPRLSRKLFGTDLRYLEILFAKFPKKNITQMISKLKLEVKKGPEIARQEQNKKIRHMLGELSSRTHFLSCSLFSTYTSPTPQTIKQGKTNVVCSSSFSPVCLFISSSFQLDSSLLSLFFSFSLSANERPAFCFGKFRCAHA